MGVFISIYCLIAIMLRPERMHVKEKKIKKTQGKERSIYKVFSIEPRDKMPMYSLVQWESQSVVV